MRDDLLEHDSHGPLDQDKTDARPHETAPPGASYYEDDRPAHEIAADDGDLVGFRGQPADKVSSGDPMEGGSAAPENPQVGPQVYKDYRTAREITAEDEGDVDEQQQKEGLYELENLAYRQEVGDFTLPPSLRPSEEAPSAPASPPHHEKESGVLGRDQKAAWDALVASQPGTPPARRWEKHDQFPKLEPQSGNTPQQPALPATHRDSHSATEAPTQEFPTAFKKPMNHESWGLPSTDDEPTRQLPAYKPGVVSRVRTWIRGGRKRTR